MINRRELPDLSDLPIPKSTPEPLGALEKPLSLRGQTPRRNVIIFLGAAVLTTAALVGVALNQQPQPLPPPRRRMPEPKPTAPPEPRSPYWGRTITISQDGTASFTDQPQIIRATLDSGEKIHAIRILEKPYEPAMHTIKQGQDIDLGAINPKNNEGVVIFGGEYLRRVDPSSGTPLQENSKPIDYKASQAVIDPEFRVYSP